LLCCCRDGWSNGFDGAQMSLVLQAGYC